MPFAAQMISSKFLQRSKRRFHRLLRGMKGQRPKVEIFIAPDDPYSYLLLQCLPQLCEKHDIEYQLHVVMSLNPIMFPELEKWQSYARKDCVSLAKHYQLEGKVFNRKSAKEALLLAIDILKLIERKAELNQILTVLDLYWSTPTNDQATLVHSSQSVDTSRSELTQKEKAQIKKSEEKLQHLGHYLPATIYFEGEWYWGVDRLHFLDERLSFDSSVISAHSAPVYPAPVFKFAKCAQAFTQPIVLYYSARSPYSYLALEQLAKLTAHYKIKLTIKPILPMLMRGIAVPNQKKMYIFNDTKREADRLQIPYGKVADPLGKAVEYCYALFEYAKSEGKEVAFLLAFGRAVNANGIRADKFSGLEYIVRSVGLNWDFAKAQMNNESWRKVEEQHRSELVALGLWGVPCVQYTKYAFWGQDRLCFLEDVLLKDESQYVS
jgi:2-hydroxychromene-2-carboxylate isomerase